MCKDLSTNESRHWQSPVRPCHDSKNQRQRTTVDIAYNSVNLIRKDRFTCSVILDHDQARGRAWCLAQRIGPPSEAHDGDHQVLYFGISAHLNFPSSDREEWSRVVETCPMPRRCCRALAEAEDGRRGRTSNGKRQEHANDKVKACHDGN